MLEPAIINDSAFIENYDVVCPVREISIRRWIDDLCFKHPPANKVHMITVHERVDDREDRKNTKLEIVNQN